MGLSKVSNLLKRLVRRSADNDELIDVIARQTALIMQQERRIQSIEKDLQTFAEVATEANYKAGQALTERSEVILDRKAIAERKDGCL